jgi:hypothetical protein
MRFLFVILTILALNSPALARAFNLVDTKYLWQSPNPETRIEFSNSTLTISSTNSSTGIYNNLPLNIPAEKFDLMIIEMKASKDGIGEVSRAQSKRDFSEDKTYSFYLKRPDGFHTYYLNLKAYNRSKTINHLLFFPFSGPGRAELKNFKLVKGSFREKLISGWQEFWGPRGREFTGRTFIVIKSTRLFGRPVFFYLNWLILLILLVSLIIKRPKFTVVSILILWVLLEMSSAVNNWLFFKRDLRFFGKTLEQKRELQNVKDFYPFMKFAEKKIPSNASFTLLVNTKYPYSSERAGYYLYPREQKETADYLLVFDRKPGRDILRNYDLIGKFRDGAYILKSQNNDMP